MPVRFVGRKSHFRGNTLFWIASNLRNLGVGRVVYRTKEIKELPEKSFYRISDVKPDFNDPDLRKGEVWGEQIFRGKSYGVVKISHCGSSDWRLIPKEDEQEFCTIDQVFEEKKRVPKLVPLPPLLGKVLQHKKNLAEPPLLKIDLPEDAEGIDYEEYIKAQNIVDTATSSHNSNNLQT